MILFFAAPALLLTWVCVHSLRSGRFPIFWFAVTLGRSGHPRLYWTLWVMMVIATGLVDYIAAVLVLAGVASSR
jgi:hypothetical protein